MGHAERGHRLTVQFEHLGVVAEANDEQRPNVEDVQASLRERGSDHAKGDDSVEEPLFTVVARPLDHLVDHHAAEKHVEAEAGGQRVTPGIDTDGLPRLG